MMAGADVLPWEEPALRAFYGAFHTHGQNWVEVSAAEGVGMPPERCESLWRQHQTFLAIPAQPAFEAAFVAMVKDHYLNTQAQQAASAPPASSQQQQDKTAAGAPTSASPAPVERHAVTAMSPARQREDDVAALGDEAAGGVDAGVTGTEDEGGANDAGDDAAGGSQQATEVSGRPVRSTRGKLPARVTSADDDAQPPSGSRGGRGAASTPRARVPASPLRGRGKGDAPDSARKKRGRRLFDDGADLSPVDELGSPLSKRGWKGKSQTQETVAFEQGVDALMQLAMATLDHDTDPLLHDGGGGGGSGEEGGLASDERMAVDGEGVPDSGLERPGKRRVRPPTRLDPTFTPPAKLAAVNGGGTPQRAGRLGSATPTASGPAMHSPRNGAWLGPGLTGPRAPRSRLRGRRHRHLLEDGEYEEEGETEMEEEGEGEGQDEDDMRRAGTRLGMHDYASDDDYEPDPPRSARKRGTASDHRRGAASGGDGASAGGRVTPDGKGRGGSELNGLSHMGSLHLPGLPGGLAAPNNGSLASYLPPVSANLGHLGSGVGARGQSSIPRLSLRMRRRKPAPERAAGGASLPGGSAAAQHQTMLMRSLLGVIPLSGLVGGDALAAGGQQAGVTLETALGHCLGSRRFRRWVVSEWHYSALDRPFFMRCELTDLLTALGLGNVHRLTRGEWGLLRSAFGTPRRLSLAFLREERVKLEAYREHVRRKYEEVGLGADVPPELPRPLRVGQEVVARHPATRALHDGLILTIKKDNYRVQFHRSELLTEVVPDVDVMPVDPRENLPLLMASPPLVLNGRSAASQAAALAGRKQARQGPPLRPMPAVAAGQHTPGGAVHGLAPGMVSPGGGLPVAVHAGSLLPPGAAVDAGGSGGAALMPTASLSAAIGSSMVPSAGDAAGAAGAGQALLTTSPPAQQPQQQPAAPLGGSGEESGADAALVAEVSSRLEAKDRLVRRLNEMNAEAEGGKHTDGSGRHSDAFQMQYTQVVLQLKEVNAALDAAYQRLQARSQEAAQGMLQSAAGVMGGSASAVGTPGGGGGGGGPVAAPAAGNGAMTADTASLQLLGLAPAVGLGVAPTLGALQLPPPATPTDLTAQALMHAAYADAKAAVQRYHEAAGATAEPGGAGPDGAGAGSGDSTRTVVGVGVSTSPRVEGVITSCLAVLCALQRVCGEPVPGPAVDASLELSIAALQHADGRGGEGAAAGPNAVLYGQIADTIRRLKVQLVDAV